ncbi:MAG: cysteine peptidase family C39 domain-containing protein [Pseudomonadota bacterium]
MSMLCRMQLLALVSLAAFTGSVFAQPSRVGDAVCGQRCIRQLLKNRGQEVSLHEIVLLSTGEELRKGLPLPRLRSLLDHFGVKCCITSAGSGRFIKLDEPYILLLRNNGQDLGHYLIVESLNPSCQIATVWDGLEGRKMLPFAALAQRSSGFVLVPIEYCDRVSEIEVLPSKSDAFFYLSLAVFLSCLLGFLLPLVKRRGM